MFYFFLVASIVAAAGFVWYYKTDGKMGSGGKSGSNATYTSGNSKKAEIMKALEIDHLDDETIDEGGVLTLKNGGLRSLISVSTSDFELLTDVEQVQFENTLMQFALSLGFPIQFFTTTLKVSTKETTDNIGKLIDEESEEISIELKRYADRLKTRLEELETERGMFVRKSYCIVAVDGIFDKKRAKTELRNRISSIRESLEVAKGIKTSVLKTPEIAQVLASQFNKGAAISVKSLLDSGALNLYTSAVEKELVADYDHEEEEEEEVVVNGEQQGQEN